MSYAIDGLLCAMTWAIATLIFARTTTSRTPVLPHVLNLAKCAVALPLLVLSALLLGKGVPAPTTHEMVVLAASAILGLAVADTAYLMTLAHLGPRRAVLFIPLVPVTTTMLSSIFLADHMTWRSLLGMGITLVGITVVLRRDDDDAGRKKLDTFGMVAAVVYVLSQSGANVLVKAAVVDVEPLHVAIVRISVGFVVVALALPVAAAFSTYGSVPTQLYPLAKNAKLVVVGAVIGTFGGLWFGTMAMQGLPAGVATTLAATTPIWTLILQRLLGQRTSLVAFAGVGIALIGVALLAL